MEHFHKMFCQDVTDPLFVSIQIHNIAPSTFHEHTQSDNGHTHWPLTNWNKIWLINCIFLCLLSRIICGVQWCTYYKDQRALPPLSDCTIKQNKDWVIEVLKKSLSRKSWFIFWMCVRLDSFQVSKEMKRGAESLMTALSKLKKDV